MKERGIIFKGWGVRAIRNMKPGVWPAEAIDPTLPIKWQTRRTRNLDEINTDPGRWTLLSFKGGVARFRHSGWAGMDDDFIEIKCPYGIPGDVLWVRETWAPMWSEDCNNCDSEPELLDEHGNCEHFYIEYRADTGNKYPGDWPDDKGDDEACGRWKPSIHLHRRNSREDLVVKEVRVERVQEINEEDARAEGVKPFGHWETDPVTGAYTERIDHLTSFEITWDAINDARGLGWEASPWVWVVSYMRKANAARGAV